MKNNLFVCYRQQFNDEVLNPDRYELHTPYFDLDLYRRSNYGDRHGICYIIRKGKNRDDLPNTFDGPIIDDMSEERKVEIFNECEKCIYSWRYASRAVSGCLGNPGRPRSGLPGGSGSDAIYESLCTIK